MSDANKLLAMSEVELRWATTLIMLRAAKFLVKASARDARRAGSEGAALVLEIEQGVEAVKAKMEMLEIERKDGKA